MAKKTAIKQLSKWLPLSAEFNAASVMDGAVRTDVSSPVTEVMPNYDVDGEVVSDDTPAVEAAPAADARELRPVPHEPRHAVLARAELEAQVIALPPDGHGLLRAHIAAAEERVRDLRAAAKALRLDDHEEIARILAQP